MVKVGVVGIGSWGKNHARVLYELNALKAICDVDKEKLAVNSKKFGVSGYTSFKEMLEKEKLDAVIIATPTSTHLSLSLEALKAGLDILVEKPLALNYREALKIAEVGEKEGRLVAVGYIERFNPAISKLKEIKEEGKLGRLEFLEIARENTWPDRIRDVGVVYDISVHDIDIARYVSSEEPICVYAKLRKTRGEREDLAVITLEHKKGLITSIISTWLSPKKRRTLKAIFTKGAVNLDFLTQEVVIEDSYGTYIPSFTWQEPLMLEDRAFLEAVEGKRRFPITAKDAIENNKIADAVFLSASKNIPIYLIQ